MKPKRKIKNEKLNEEQSIALHFEYFSKINEKYNKLMKNFDYMFRIFNMQKNILEHKNDIWIPELNIQTKSIKTNSWFEIKRSKIQNVTLGNNIHKLIENKPKPQYKSKKIILDLTKVQKKIIDEWLDTYASMYNISLDYIKNNINTDKKVLNFIYLRAKLYNEKTELIKKSTLKVHDIDGAIKLACTNYKSALTNYKNGNIKNFRLRSWNKNKDNKIVDLEKSNFSNNTIRKNILGNVKGYYNGKKYNFNDIDCDSKILKNKIGQYILLVPELLGEYKETKINNTIVSDLGARTFATCITKNRTIEIGTNASKKITSYLKKKDRIMNDKNIGKGIKKKNERIINRKISNIVDELHWKTIDMMTNIADTIIIGDIHSKSIVEGNKLGKLTKRVILALRFDEFKKRIEYKCLYKNKKLSKPNEWMTSKMCSCCGCINENLGSKKVFECIYCGIIIDRDINGTRNIYIVSIA